MKNKLIKLENVLKLSQLSRSQLYYQIADGTFPSPIKIGKRSVAWIESDIDKWIDQMIEKSKKVSLSSIQID